MYRHFTAYHFTGLTLLYFFADIYEAQSFSRISRCLFRHADEWPDLLVIPLRCGLLTGETLQDGKPEPEDFRTYQESLFVQLIRYPRYF